MRDSKKIIVPAINIKLGMGTTLATHPTEVVLGSIFGYYPLPSKFHRKDT